MIVVQPQHSEGAQYKSWGLTCSLFSAVLLKEVQQLSLPSPFLGCSKLICTGLEGAARGRRCSGCPSTKLHFVRILKERSGGDLGACFYRAHFSTNGFKNKLTVGIVHPGLCRDMFQAAVNSSQMVCRSFWSTTVCWRSSLHSLKCHMLFLPLAPEVHLLLWWNRTILKYRILKTCLGLFCFQRKLAFLDSQRNFLQC